MIKRKKGIWGWQALLSTLVVFALLVSSAHAQVVEQNRPRLLTGQQLTGLPGGAVDTPAAPSDAPLGADLVSLILVDRPQDVVSSPRLEPGINVENVILLQDPAFAALMQPFLNRPLSQKLIANIRDEIVKFYRSKKRPLVTVSVLPQEITKGVLQLVVTQFRIGEIKTVGNLWTSDDYILRNIQLSPGDEIASDKLVEDTNWLNLNPYRNLTAVFEPGRKPGETNLTLRSRETRPWSVYAGYANSGTPSTDRNRTILGFNVANVLMTDSQLAYQLTTSPNVWYGGGDIFGGAGKPDYLSQSATYFIPLPWRHKVNLQASNVKTNATLTAPFTQSNETTQVYGEYAVPVSSSGPLRVEIYGGIDLKNQKTDVFFAGATARKTTLNIVQGVIGTRAQVTHRLGVAGFDVRGIFSPGGVVGNNNDAAFAAASTNPNASSSYSYFYGKFNQVTPVFGTGFALQTNLTLQLSGKALPGIEQLTLGGAATVRGYNELEVSGDKGVIFSNELRTPPFKILSRGSSRIEDQAVLYGFLDYGYARDRFAGVTHQLAGVGVGVDYSLNNYLQMSLSYGNALKNSIRTEKGEQRGNINVTFKY